ncbi:EF-hand calcium-binding domain-containing protein 6-like [Pristis pectinata]|uniref:EF-hand calcium-binding domain-containing protein 6-like n=1 Tax=Pristis pectinata TaxID=685728 RepID=UPI00223E3078|nr:EF-hand calcium-binding domain-containing protein 6-like [Pristis pectinata]
MGLRVEIGFPELQHPLSRLGDPETVSVQGVSTLSSRGLCSGRSASQKRENSRMSSRFSESVSERSECGSALEKTLRKHKMEQLDNWRKLDRWLNLKKQWACDPRIADHDAQTIISPRPGTQMRLKIDELQYLLHEKIRSGGFYTLKQLFQANDPIGRGHVTREVLLTVLTRFLKRFIATNEFYHLLLRLKLNEKAIITFENFYLHFKEQEPKGYPAWMDPVKRPNESKMLSSTQAHLQLKAMVKERPMELRDLFTKMDNGRMLATTFQNALHQLGIEMEQEEFKKLLKRYDPNNSGTVKADSLMRILGFQAKSDHDEGWNKISSALGKTKRFRLSEHQPRLSGRNRTKAEKERKLTLDIENWLKEKFREGFKSMKTDFCYYDQDNSGKVTRENFLRVLKVFDLRLKEDQLNIFLVRCGLQEDAPNINYIEFLHNFQDRSENGVPHRIITDENHRFNKFSSFGSQSSVTALEAKLMNLLHYEFLSLLGIFHKIDNKKLDVISQQEFWAVLNSRFGINMTDEEMNYLMNRIPLDHQGNVKYLEFMSMFDSCKGAKSLLGDKSMMTNLSKEQPAKKEHSFGRTTDQISKIIQNLLKKHYRMVEESFNKLDTMNTKQLSPESMYQLMKQFDIHPPISRDEVSKLWSTLITSQNNSLDFHQFVRHFGFSPKSACFPNAKICPPVKGDSDFLIRSKKLNCDTDIIEDNLQAKIQLLLDDLWTSFRELDQFNSGFVSKEEFKDILMVLCVALNDQACEMITSKFDHGQNRISYVEFLQPFEDRRKSFKLDNLKTQKQLHPEFAVYTESMHKGLGTITEKLRKKLAGNWKTLDRVCKKLDYASTGFLTLPEFRSVLQLCNIVLDEEEMYQLMSKYDEDMDGKIKYTKLINKIFKTL